MGGYGPLPYTNYKGELVTAIDNDYVDGLISEGIGIVDPTLREQCYNELEDLYYAECPSIMTFQPYGRHYERTWVHGWFYHSIYPGLMFRGEETLWKEDPATVNRDAAVDAMYAPSGSWTKYVTVYNLGDNPEYIDLYEKITVNGIVRDEEYIQRWVPAHGYFRKIVSGLPDGTIEIVITVEISNWVGYVPESNYGNNAVPAGFNVYGDIAGGSPIKWGAFDNVCDYKDANKFAEAYKKRTATTAPYALADLGNGSTIGAWNHPDGVCDYKDASLFSRAYKARTSRVPV
jgi:hypothetical protein